MSKIVPFTMNMIKIKYCELNKNRCARYRLLQVDELAKIPDDLWPNDEINAMELLESKLDKTRKKLYSGNREEETDYLKLPPMGERLFQRLQANYQTTIMTKDGKFTGIMDNISMGGFFLTTNNQIKVGEEIAVRIVLQNDAKNMNIVSNATVVRVEENGIAFKFEQMEHYNYWTLHSYLHYVNA